MGFEEEGHSNEVSFVELLHFHAKNDPILAQHLANSPRNAAYSLKTIQNELIEAIDSCIRENIIQEVKKAKYYSIIADKVADISNNEHAVIPYYQVCLDGGVKNGLCEG